MPLTLADFVARWRAGALTERAAAQSHFIDPCDALGVPRPAAVDQTGASYSFEKGLTKTGGGRRARRPHHAIFFRPHIRETVSSSPASPASQFAVSRYWQG